MPDMNQKLDRFTAKILAEAADESKRALAEVKRRRELRFQEAEDAALKEAYEYIHGEVARIQSEAGRGVSRHMLENKRALYLRRTEMAQEVFALVRAKIAAFTRTPAYGQRLTALLAEALELDKQDSVYYPAVPCVRMVFCTHNEVFLRYENLQPALSYLEKHAFALAGDILGRSIARVMGKDNTIIHYYDVWLPIKDREIL